METETLSESKMWIRLIKVDKEQPAFAPDTKAETFLEAYKSFLYTDEESVRQEIKDDWLSQRADYLSQDEDQKDEDSDEYFESETPPDDEDYYLSCTVDEDGTIHTDFTDLTAEWVFEAYGLQVPDQLKQKAPKP